MYHVNSINTYIKEYIYTYIIYRAILTTYTAFSTHCAVYSGQAQTAQWAIAGDKLSLKWSKQTTNEQQVASGKWQEECNKRGQGGCLQPGNEATC